MSSLKSRSLVEDLNNWNIIYSNPFLPKSSWVRQTDRQWVRAVPESTGLCILPQKTWVSWTALLQPLGNLEHSNTFGGTIVKWQKAWPLDSNPGPRFSLSCDLNKILYWAYWTSVNSFVNDEMMYVKQVLSRKGSKFATISLFRQSLVFSISWVIVVCLAAPWSPCYLASSILWTCSRYPFPSLSSPPLSSFVHFPCNQGGSLPCMGPNVQKSVTKSLWFCQLSLSCPLAGMCGQHMPRHGLLNKALGVP